MNEKNQEELKSFGKHALHGAEEVADVLAHGVGGAVKGVADGVESASANTKTRNADEKD